MTGALGVVVAADKEPSLPADGNPAQFALGSVVVEDQSAVVEHPHQSVLLTDGVAQGGAQNRPEIRCGRVRVEFVARANVGDIPTVERNTLRGVLRVSTPEATAFDLTGYPIRAGGISNVATVLAELAESMDAARLLAEADHSPLPWTQRLGYLLELVGFEPLAAPLAEYVSKRAKEYVPLRTRKTAARASRAPRWRLLVNEEVEADL